MDSFALSSPEEARSASTREHREGAPGRVSCWIVTVSDTRTLETDRGGALIEHKMSQAGHEVKGREIVRDELAAIRRAVETALQAATPPDAVIVTGGSGIGPRDVTPEALRPLLTRELPGFGEVFRVLSWHEVGAATMLSRAFAGACGQSLLFVLPGSTNAVALALDQLIVPEIAHLVSELRGRDSQAHVSG